MTQEAIVIAMYAASQMTSDEQAEFAAYLSKLLETYYRPNDIVITGRTMEAIIENYENEKATSAKR